MRRLLLIKLTTLMLFLPSFADEKMKPEEVVTKHLESIGTKEARKTIKNIVGRGSSKFDLLRSPSETAGQFILASENNKFIFGSNFNNTNYPHERFSFNGKDVTIAFINQGTRSSLGAFLFDNKYIIDNGIFGGTLTTGWSLHKFPTEDARLTGGNKKKIEGIQCYVTEYEFKKGSDLKIKMFFAADTFRHIRTEYTQVISARMGSALPGSQRENTGANSASQQEVRTTLREDFSDFKDVGGITLPHSYKIYLANSGVRRAGEYEWSFTFEKFDLNQNLDPASFELNTD